MAVSLLYRLITRSLPLCSSLFQIIHPHAENCRTCRPCDNSRDRGIRHTQRSHPLQIKDSRGRGRAASRHKAAPLKRHIPVKDSRKDREIATLTAQLTAANSRAERQAELAPIYQQLSEIACNQPPVKKICCPEQYVPVNTGINALYALIPDNRRKALDRFLWLFGKSTDDLHKALDRERK